MANGRKVPPDIITWEIPAQTYAVLPVHDVPGIGPVSNYFEQEWLPKSKDWEAAGLLMIELYPETYSQDLIICMHFPIRHKGG